MQSFSCLCACQPWETGHQRLSSEDPLRFVLQKQGWSNEALFKCSSALARISKPITGPNSEKVYRLRRKPDIFVYLSPQWLKQGSFHFEFSLVALEETGLETQVEG